MAEDALRSAIDSISRRLHEELETQLAVLRSQHLDELETARRTAEAEAEQRWSAKVDEVRAEWTARLESEVAAARSEAERRMVAESMRIRVEAEQAAAESVTRVRQELDDAVAQERQRAEGELSAAREQAARENNAAREQAAREREELQREVQELREQLQSLGQQADALTSARESAEAALADERRAREEEARRREEMAAAETEARVAERQAQLAVVERLLGGIRSLDSARSLSQVLSALLTAAAAEAPRTALFVVNGRELKGWKAEGFGVDAASLQANTTDNGLLAEVLRRAEPLAATTEQSGPVAPAFAQLPADRAAIAVPLLVGGQPVALLYADDAGEGEAEAPASWPEAIQILCRHASVNLAHLTAARAAEAMRRSLVPPAAVSRGGAGAAASSGPAAPDDGSSARRYARLLVSEIKLYNEAAVRVGRQNRDLLARLKPEIDRARRLYEQRFSPEVDSRGALFQQELVQTLADGDPALLGGPA